MTATNRLLQLPFQFAPDFLLWSMEATIDTYVHYRPYLFKRTREGQGVLLRLRQLVNMLELLKLLGQMHLLLVHLLNFAMTKAMIYAPVFIPYRLPFDVHCIISYRRILRRISLVQQNVKVPE
jgi:hypothetical protein